MAWFDCAQRKPINTNIGGSLGPNLGLILHHAVMNGSLQGFFNNPSAQVSAHFWVAKSGVIEQYVDTAVVAWHAKQLNGRYVGVETEGCATSPYAEPFTQAQIQGLATLYAEGMRRHGWPNRLSNTDGEPGFGFHRMAVNTACPCDVRLNKRSEILDIATGVSTTPTPTPEPPLVEEDEMITPVLKLGSQIHQFQASIGTLWHWWSDNEGNTWRWERLIGPTGAPINAKAETVQGTVINDKWMYITSEDSDKAVWICRQEKGRGWDIRRPSA